MKVAWGGGYRSGIRKLVHGTSTHSFESDPSLHRLDKSRVVSDAFSLVIRRLSEISPVEREQQLHKQRHTAISILALDMHSLCIAFAETFEQIQGMIETC